MTNYENKGISKLWDLVNWLQGHKMGLAAVIVAIAAMTLYAFKG